MPGAPGRTGPRGRDGADMSRWLLLGKIVSCAGEATLEGRPAPAPFLDYDCDLAHTIPGAAADWNQVYASSVAGRMSSHLMGADFSFPKGLEHLIHEKEQDRSKSRTEQAAKECPLGVLYLKIAYFYGRNGDACELDVIDTDAAEEIQRLLSLYPAYVMALSRWPIFPVLAFYRPLHQSLENFTGSMACDNVKGVIDWDHCRVQAARWIELQFGVNKTEEEKAELIEVQQDIADQFYVVLRKAHRQQQAYEECPFGFFYLAATQLVAAAGKGTNHMPPFSRIIDEVVSDLPFIQVSSSPWPVWHVLAIFADMNKGTWFWGGDRKYFRGYSDWNLRRDELSPLISPRLEFLSYDWQIEAMLKVEALKAMSHKDYMQALRSWTRSREDSWGPLRPIVMGMIDAASTIAARAQQHRLERRLAYVVLLYGDSWADLLGRMTKRMAQLSFQDPLLVIAIDEAAEVCRALGRQSEDVICWVPETASQVHRFTGIQGLIHLGIDVIYLDMDTFLLRDPTARFQAAAVGWDALFARHGDGDCVNIGVFYLKANGRTAVWMSQFLAWYHDHPFEIDQRGLHIFLGLPSMQLEVAHIPKDLVRIRGSVLEDWNEVVIGDIGWVGSFPMMQIFHWCHRPLELKVHEMNLAYDAADVLEDHELPLSLALSVGSGAVPDSPWARVVAVKFVFESYQLKEAPGRRACW
ncbi:Nucleotid_trans domain-containing protein [Durusdinium trenchii]|uniref:Nucleotid_trans domain-containing protein n=1 Tax=Durusdinium trenchii TaxID=1381693 RepID=A0ABP0JD39_9DINO